MKYLSTVSFFLFFIAPAYAAPTPLPSVAFTEYFTSNQWGIQTPLKGYSVQYDADSPRHPGGRALRFELRGGDVWKTPLGESFRSELATNDYVSLGQTQWYGMSLFIPSDFPIENNRLVVGQWHGMSAYDNQQSPALAQRFVNGTFSITVNHDGLGSGSPEPQQESVFRTRNFNLGQWNDLVYQIHWSAGTDGFLQVWLNGVPVANYSGPIGYRVDAIAPAFRFGIYRDASDKTYVVRYDEVRRGASYRDVDPALVRQAR